MVSILRPTSTFNSSCPRVYIGFTGEDVSRQCELFFVYCGGEADYMLFVRSRIDAKYIPANTSTPVDERFFNLIKYYLRS